MTKEKPVGLIVGLLLIIGFGLILSMLMGTEDKLPPASAAAEENPNAYASAYTIDDSARYTPVLGGGDLSASAAGGGALADASGVESRMVPPGADDREGVIISELLPARNVLAATDTPAGGVVPALSDETIPPGMGHPREDAGLDGMRQAPAAGFAGGVAPEPARGRTYVVQAGDNLTKIARKMYGQGKDREYKRIFEANRGVLRSESDLSIGQELVIPPLPASESASAPLDGASGRLASAPADRSGRGRYATATMDDLSAALASMGRRPAPAAGRSYVIQRGDNLEAIARRMMNDDSPSAVRELYEANRGVLESPHRLRIGVELKLP